MRMLGVIKLLALGIVNLYASFAYAQAGKYPVPNVLEHTPQNFCAGMQNVAQTSKVSIQKAFETLCPQGAPSELLLKMIDNPYKGGEDTQPYLNIIANNVEGRNVRMHLGFTVSVPGNAVKGVLNIEKFLLKPFASDVFTAAFEYTTPKPNDNVADAIIGLKYTTKARTRQVSFDDTVTFTCHVHKMHPDNFDFFVVAGQILEPTPQTQESSMFIGLMRDPKNPDNTLIVVINNSLYKHHGFADRVSGFIKQYWVWFLTNLQKI